MSEILHIYRRLWQVNWAEQWQYRANLAMYLLYWIVSPVVYLSVWTAVANQQGSVNGLTANDLSTYYLTLLLVSTLTGDITIYLLAYKIQDGTLSSDLLKPIHPVLTNVLMNNLAFKALMLLVLVPVWLALVVLVQPDFRAVTIESTLLAIPAVTLAFLINFFLSSTITSIAFWTTRVMSIAELNSAIVTLFAGQFVPLELMPPFLRQLAEILPFQLLQYFPIQLVLGRLPSEVIVRNFLLDVVWLVVMFAVFMGVWRAGLKRFSAVGA